MKSKIIRKELEQMAPGLRLPEDEAVPIPEGYFEKMQAELYQKLDIETKPTSTHTRVVPLASQLRKWAAVGIILVVSSLAVFLLVKSPETTEQPLASLSPEEALQYVDDNIEEFEAQLLAEFMPEEEAATDYFEDEFPSEEALW